MTYKLYAKVFLSCYKFLLLAHMYIVLLMSLQLFRTLLYVTNYSALQR